MATITRGIKLWGGDGDSGTSQEFAVTVTTTELGLNLEAAPDAASRMQLMSLGFQMVDQWLSLEVRHSTVIPSVIEMVQSALER